MSLEAAPATEGKAGDSDLALPGVLGVVDWSRIDIGEGSDSGADRV